MIYTWSKFTYGHTVDSSNQYIPFKEGTGAEIIASVDTGDYSLGEFVVAIQDALNNVGDLTYTVTIDRTSNNITVAATGTFKLLTHSGSVTATAFDLMGFEFPSADLTGSTSYSGNHASGSEYYPQFLLQSYVSPDDFVESVEASINQSADGRVEIVRFGINQKIEMDINFITNLPMDGVTFRNDPNGLQNARAFLNYITQKKKFEFFPDKDATSTYYKVILESSPGYNNGTGFKLKERFPDGLPDFYDTGVLQLRVVA